VGIGSHKRAAAIILVLALAGIQLIPVRRTNPPVASDVDAPAPVQSILRRACYDCHSNETRWPWYSRVAPVSWLVSSHVQTARGDLNFSEWPLLDFEGQDLARGDIREQVGKGKMPLRSYTWIHRGARLKQEERDAIVEWASGITQDARP
jgi:hypothetical protein